MITVFDESLDHPFLIDDKFRHLAVAHTDRWIIFVHPDQSFAGRMYIAHWKFKQRREMKVDDVYELNAIAMPWVEDTIIDLIGEPAEFNTAQFGNTWKHLHYHVIPRHREDVVVGNVFVGRENEKDLCGNYAHSSRYRRLRNIQVAKIFAQEIREKR